MKQDMEGIDIDAIYKNRKLKPIKNRNAGYCPSCNAKLHDREYCDNWCREDHEFEQEMRRVIVKNKR